MHFVVVLKREHAMRKVYYEDTYQKELDCTVTEVTRTAKATEVLTDSTLFYGECGGQPGDRGIMVAPSGQLRILDTRKADNGDSVLILEKDVSVESGQSVRLILDWEHRYKFMAVHAAQHMLSGLMYNEFGIGTVSVHQGDEYLTIETDKDSIDDSVVDAIVKSANEKIAQGHPIIYHELSHSDAEALGMRRSIKVEGDVRIVEIVGVDTIACGGIHVANTSELRILFCCGKEQIRGHVRLYFKCAQQAVDELLSSQSIMDRIRLHMSCTAQDVPDKVEVLEKTITQLRAEKNHAAKGLAKYEIDDSLAKAGTDIVTLIAEQNTDLTAYAAAVPLYENLALCIVTRSKDKCSWMIALKGKYESVDFNGLRKTLLPKINAKGGGRVPVFQGIGFVDTEDDIKAFLEEFKKSII